MVKGLNLSESAIQNITYNNYRKIIGTPKKVDMEKVVEYAKRIYKDLSEKTLESPQMLGDIDGSDSKKWLEEFFERIAK